MSTRRFVHIVWSPATGPMRAYVNPSLAFDHARVMAGVDVASLEISHALPPNILDDIMSDDLGAIDEDTPLDRAPVQVKLDEIDEVVQARIDDDCTIVIEDPDA